MNPHDGQPRDEQPRETDRAEVTDLPEARRDRADGPGHGVAASGSKPAPVPGPDDDREWYPL